MDKSVKRCFALFLAVLMVSAMFVVPAQAIPVKTGEIVSYNQWDYKNNSWSSYEYGRYNPDGTGWADIGSSGCGLVAFTNAVYYLNGNFVDPRVLADYALTHKNPATGRLYRVNGSGTDDAMYEPFINDNNFENGRKYGIVYVGVAQGTALYDSQGNLTGYVLSEGLEKLKPHLRLGRVAIGFYWGHIMAIVDWDMSTDRYLLLDSAPKASRGTSSGYAWKTANELANLKIQGKFHVIENAVYARANGKPKCNIKSALDRNMSLDLLDGCPNNGTNIQTYTSHSGGAQIFALEHVGNGWHKIWHIESGKVLDIAGINRASGTNVFLWEDTGGTNQLWRFIPSNGGYRIQSRLGTYLDVQGGCATDFNNVWAYEGNDTNAQLWYFEFK